MSYKDIDDAVSELIEAAQAILDMVRGKALATETLRVMRRLQAAVDEMNGVERAEEPPETQ